MVLTAKGDEDNEVRVFELGADDFITKPFRAKALSARLGRSSAATRLTKETATTTSSTPVRPTTRDSTGPGEASDPAEG